MDIDIVILWVDGSDPAWQAQKRKYLPPEEKDSNSANRYRDWGLLPYWFPQLTEERRKDLTKQVKKYAEEAKVAMRNIRRDGMDYVKKLKKNSEITEDDQKKAEKDLQDLLDKNIKKVDVALAAKEKELMAI